MATVNNDSQAEFFEEPLPVDGADASSSLSDGEENEITPEEIELLDNAGVVESEEDEDIVLAKAQLDEVDDDGEPLKETTGFSGSDLDVPGSELDDEDELTGREDEENNAYSTTDQDDDDDDL